MLEVKYLTCFSWFRIGTWFRFCIAAHMRKLIAARLDCDIHLFPWLYKVVVCSLFVIFDAGVKVPKPKNRTEKDETVPVRARIAILHFFSW